MRFGQVESSPVKTRLSFNELHPHALAGGALDEGTQVIEVAGEPVHAVNDHGDPFAGEPEQFSQLWPGGVPAGGLVYEDPVQNLAFKLALLVLIQRAHPQTPDPPSGHRRLQPSTCRSEFQTLIGQHSIGLTLGRVPDRGPPQ
jgi:hypothetical protein